MNRKLCLSSYSLQKICCLQLKNVIFELTLSYVLLSVSFMARADLKAVFKNNMCRVLQSGGRIAQRCLFDRRHYLNTANNQTICNSNAVLFAGLKCWHKRLGHPHIKAIQNMHRHHVVEGMQIDSEIVSDKSVSCTFGKSS